MANIKHGTLKSDGSSYSIGQPKISSTFKGFGIFTNKPNPVRGDFYRFIKFPEKVIIEC